MLYSHKDNINHNSDTNRFTNTQYKYRRILLFQIRTGLLTSVFGPWQHEERDTILTMLTPSPRAAHLVVFKFSVGRDPKIPTTSFNGQKSTLNGRIPNSRLNAPISTDFFFKILKFSGPSLLGMTSSTLQAHFLSGGLLWQWWLLYRFRTSVNCTNWLWTWVHNPNRSKPNQTKW